MGSPKNEGPKGFLEILFGKNPNKGKVRRCAAVDSHSNTLRIRFATKRAPTRPNATEPTK
jgi:hypothetical protein